MNNNTSFSDIRHGDRQAFDALVEQYNEALTAFVFHIVKERAAAEDIVQDVFVNVWMGRKKIDFGLPLKNFLYVSCRNLAYNYLRSARNLSEHLKKMPFPDDTTITGYVVKEEANRLLSDAIGKLPAQTAAVMRLSLEGMKQEEIAGQLGVGVANVKRLKAIGIKKLKEIMVKAMLFVVM